MPETKIMENNQLLPLANWMNVINRTITLQIAVKIRT
jgi:hypothetical protein